MDLSVEPEAASAIETIAIHSYNSGPKHHSWATASGNSGLYCKAHQSLLLSFDDIWSRTLVWAAVTWPNLREALPSQYVLR